MTVLATARSGFGTDADRYARGRPDYPPEVAGWLAGTIGLAPGKTVVDLGAGTGKFTARLIATGATTVAVEPVAAMRDKLAVSHPQVEALDGSATAIPLAGASVDAVVCAQAFHWFATAEALAEIHRVLKPGGRLGLIWNTRDESVPWVRAAFAIADAIEGDTPRFRTGAWRRCFPAKGFAPLQEAVFTNEHRGSPEDVLINRMLSTSFVAILPQAERDHFVSRLRALIASEPAIAGQAEIAVPYKTFAYSTERL
jgi:SAM-dependent methyltransferase